MIYFNSGQEETSFASLKGLRTFALSPLKKIMLTDYSKINNLLLAYPERFYKEYESLTSFYDNLIELILHWVQLWIVSNNQSSIQKIKQKFYYKKINFIGIKGWDEIWLRDCIGFKKDDEIIKPYYIQIIASFLIPLIPAITINLISFQKL